MIGSNDKQDGNSNSNISEPGLPALLKRLNAWWQLEKWDKKAECDILDDPRSILTALAIPLDKAYEIWGYGGAAAMSKPATAPATLKDWTGEQLAAQRAVFVAEGHRDPIKRLSEETGLKDREIRRRIAAHEKPTSVAKKAGPYSQLIVKKPGNKR